LTGSFFGYIGLTNQPVIFSKFDPPQYDIRFFSLIAPVSIRMICSPLLSKRNAMSEDIETSTYTLKAVRKKRLYEEIVSQIQRLIETGEMHSEDRLPPEELYPSAKRRNISFKAHLKIVEAIEKKDPELVWQEMDRHLTGIEHIVFNFTEKST
jgi:DNA-binding GntR family transcriptional regulator